MSASNGEEIVHEALLKQHLKFGDAHDDQHTDNELVWAAIAYASHAVQPEGPHPFWPLESEWSPPTAPIDTLADAAAMLISEIDRRLRAPHPPTNG